MNEKEKKMSIEQLMELLKRYEKALDEEVWSSKLGKFVPFREMPNVAKILKEPIQDSAEDSE